MNFINRKVAFLEGQWSQTTCTLSEAIENKDAARIISDSLYVACVYDGLAYVTDNLGHWAAIVLDDLGDSIAQDCIIPSGLQGYMATTSTNPTFLLDEEINGVISGRPAKIDTMPLDQPITLRGNTVVNVEGYYMKNALWPTDGLASVSLHLDMVKQLPDSCLAEGDCGVIMGILDQRNPLVVNQEDGGDAITESQSGNDNYEFIPLKVIAKRDLLWGDINADGYVDVMDVSKLINIILNMQGNVYSAVFDVNKDLKIDVMDVSKLIEMVLSLKE